MLEGRLDVSILRHSASDQAEIVEEMIVRERLVAALPASHPLAGRAGPFKLSELRFESFILAPRNVGLGLRDAVLATCRQAGFEPNVGLAAPHIASILSLVAAELVVSLVPWSMAQINVTGVVLKELDEPSAAVGLSLAFARSTTNVIVRNFVQIMRQLIELQRRTGEPFDRLSLGNGKEHEA